MKWRVEFIWYSGGSFGPFASVAYRMVGIGLGQQQAGGIALGIAHDFATRRIGRVLGVAHRSQRGAVQQWHGRTGAG